MSLPAVLSVTPASACTRPFASARVLACQPRKVRCCSEAPTEQASSRTFHRLQSTEEERRKRPVNNILDTAEDELEGFCSALNDEEGSEECWDAYQYYEKKRAEAESACEIEGGKNSGLTGPQCQRLEQFENFVRQMVGEGHVVNFITTLQSLSHADQRRLAKELEGSNSEQAAVHTAAMEVQESLQKASEDDMSDFEADSEQRRNRLRTLFEAMDHDGNGKLDVAEFRDAMRELGDELTGQTVSTIFDSMDVHGWISLDQFIAIVEAEAIESHSADARMLRRLSKDPVWWTRSMDR